MNEEKHSGIKWMDVLWLVFLLGLAVLPPVEERHKQLALLAIGIVQLAEGRIVATWPRSGLSAVVLVKIVLATLLINHTGELGINSSYYPIYYVPIVTAAIHFGSWGTLLWTLLASAAYCSYLYPALQEYTLTPTGAASLPPERGRCGQRRQNCPYHQYDPGPPGDPGSGGQRAVQGIGKSSRREGTGKPS